MVRVSLVILLLLICPNPTASMRIPTAVITVSIGPYMELKPEASITFMYWNTLPCYWQVGHGTGKDEGHVAPTQRPGGLGHPAAYISNDSL